LILFKPEHVGPILSGQKTQTRRTGKKRWRVGSVHQCRLNYRVEPFARGRITRVRRKKLGAISEADDKKEGYPSVGSYREAFTRIYGFWDPNVEVWVVDFVLCD